MKRDALKISIWTEYRMRKCSTTYVCLQFNLLPRAATLFRGCKIGFLDLSPASRHSFWLHPTIPPLFKSLSRLFKFSKGHNQSLGHHAVQIPHPVISLKTIPHLTNRPRSICFAAQGGNYTKSRPGGRWVERWRQPRVSLILFFLVTIRYVVSEMVLTCTVSIYIICKYGNGEIFTQSEEESGSRHL